MEKGKVKLQLKTLINVNNNLINSFKPSDGKNKSITKEQLLCAIDTVFSAFKPVIQNWNEEDYIVIEVGDLKAISKNLNIATYSKAEKQYFNIEEIDEDLYELF